MATNVSICNRALQILGADSIIDLTEDNARARAMTIAFESVRDAEIERNKWKFAIKRVELAALSAAPDFDYDRQFQLPPDYLRHLPGGSLVYQDDLSDYRGSVADLFVVEGDKLLTNLDAPLNLRYIARITDASLFSPSFAEALAARLAFECCERITGSDGKEQLAMRRYKAALREAVRANALESPPRAIGDSSWVTARLG